MGKDKEICPKCRKKLKNGKCMNPQCINKDESIDISTINATSTPERLARYLDTGSIAKRPTSRDLDISKTNEELMRLQSVIEKQDSLINEQATKIKAMEDMFEKLKTQK